MIVVYIVADFCNKKITHNENRTDSHLFQKINVIYLNVISIISDYIS